MVVSFWTMEDRETVRSQSLHPVHHPDHMQKRHSPSTEPTDLFLRCWPVPQEFSFWVKTGARMIF